MRWSRRPLASVSWPWPLAPRPPLPAGYLSGLSGLLTGAPGWAGFLMAGAVVAGAVGLSWLGGKVERAKVEAVRSDLDTGIA